MRCSYYVLEFDYVQLSRIHVIYNYILDESYYILEDYLLVMVIPPTSPYLNSKGTVQLLIKK